MYVSKSTKSKKCSSYWGAFHAQTTGLVPVKSSNGERILKGKNVTSFTTAEEDVVGFDAVLPFRLETKLRDIGANFVAVGKFQKNVQVNVAFVKDEGLL